MLLSMVKSIILRYRTTERRLLDRWNGQLFIGNIRSVAILLRKSCTVREARDGEQNKSLFNKAEHWA